MSYGQKFRSKQEASFPFFSISLISLALISFHLNPFSLLIITEEALDLS